MPNKEELCSKLIRDAYDLHIHPAPSPFQRGWNDIQLLQDSGRAGMAGILLKSHYEPTAARAKIANRYSNSSAVAYGSIVLNWPVGGLNPYAVHNALKRGAKIVFMPTRDAENSLKTGNMPGDFFCRPGISITEEGHLKPEVYDIMDAIIKYDAVLATGHISPEESVILCHEGSERGVRMILTHPEFSRTRIPCSIQRELAGMGVYIEKCWYNIAEHEIAAAEMAANIREIGAEHCFMTTDRGQKNREKPVQALKQFAYMMLENNINEQQLHIMMNAVPKDILRVDAF